METDPDKTGGWTFFKVVGVIVGTIGMLGFGLCSLCGLVMGVASGGSDIGIFLAYSLPGLVLASLFFLMIRAIVRAARRK
jgi:hypothetical protein